MNRPLCWGQQGDILDPGDLTTANSQTAIIQGDRPRAYYFGLIFRSTKAFEETLNPTSRPLS